MSNTFFTVTIIVLLLLSCSSPRASDVAKQFISQLYQLDYDQIDKIATGDALLQASILQGRLEGADEQAQGLYLNKSVVITSAKQLLSKAYITFDVIDSTGTTTSNSLEVEKIKGKWMVTVIEKSPVPTIKFFFN